MTLSGSPNLLNQSPSAPTKGGEHEWVTDRTIQPAIQNQQHQPLACPGSMQTRETEQTDQERATALPCTELTTQ